MAYSGPAKLPMAAERAGRRQRSSSLSTIHSQVSVQEYIGYVFFGFKRAFFFYGSPPILWVAAALRFRVVHP